MELGFHLKPYVKGDNETLNPVGSIDYLTIFEKKQ
jgi:hypothetical protein